MSRTLWISPIAFWWIFRYPTSHIKSERWWVYESGTAYSDCVMFRYVCNFMCFILLYFQMYEDNYEKVSWCDWKRNARKWLMDCSRSVWPGAFFFKLLQVRKRLKKFFSFSRLQCPQNYVQNNVNKERERIKEKGNPCRGWLSLCPHPFCLSLYIWKKAIDLYNR